MNIEESIFEARDKFNDNYKNLMKDFYNDWSFMTIEEVYGTYTITIDFDILKPEVTCIYHPNKLIEMLIEANFDLFKILEIKAMEIIVIHYLNRYRYLNGVLFEKK